jgi:alpha-D-ribose 1-methylphosphonate 5-triphosphate diphosphatase
MATEQTLSNARIVLRDEVVHGAVRIVDGCIADISSGGSVPSGAVDLEGDYLLPGLIEMHTDHLEKHMVPRPGVHWPLPVGAALAHDVQIAGAGITTVFDAIAVGTYRQGRARQHMLERAIAAIATGKSDNLFRADHLLHLRCEVSDPDMLKLVEAFIDVADVRLISLMDHTPGQRQWRDLSLMKRFHNNEDMSDADLKAFVDERVTLQRAHAEPHRLAVVEMCRSRGLPMASHDDTTIEHVAEAVAHGITISEFPTTMEAARAARAEGMAIVMGAPNIVLGGSHSGNVSAEELAQADLLDGLSSDYVPSSLIQAVFLMHDRTGIVLPDAVATVSANVADMVGLDDRGVIVAGKRADLVRVHDARGLPVVRQVWREGLRVA